VRRFIDEYRGAFGVEFICQALGVSASAYYQRAKGKHSARERDDERLLPIMREIHKANFEATLLQGSVRHARIGRATSREPAVIRGAVALSR